MANEPPQELQQAIGAAMMARGWIVNSYAQFENLLSDFVGRARQLSEYADVAVPFRTTSRISSVREILGREGPLAQFREPVGDLLDRFEAFEDSRLMLVHAFTTIYHTPNGDIGFEFELYRRGAGGETVHRRQLYRPHELDAERETFVAFAQEALERFSDVHHAMGWAGE